MGRGVKEGTVIGLFVIGLHVVQGIGICVNTVIGLFVIGSHMVQGRGLCVNTVIGLHVTQGIGLRGMRQFAQSSDSASRTQSG